MFSADRLRPALLVLAVAVLAGSLSLAVAAGPAGAAHGAGGGGGYWMAGADGKVYRFGSAVEFGSVPGPLNQPVVCMTSSATGHGYWLVARDGGVFAFGDAPYSGSTGSIRLNQPIVGMAAVPPPGSGSGTGDPGGGGTSPGGPGTGGTSGGTSPSGPGTGGTSGGTSPSGPGTGGTSGGTSPGGPGTGYWLVAADGGVFAFGTAAFFGSTGAIRLNQPIVGMAATPSGQGYWLVARDGGVFAFGDAAFHGSTGNIRLNQPVVGMAATPSGGGYWLAASDGGVFAFGDAGFLGAAAGRPANSAPVAGVAATASGQGYWLAARDGGVFAYGDAPFVGSAAGAATTPVVAIAPVGRPGGCGGYEEPPPPPESIPPDRVAEAARWAAGRAGLAGFTIVDTVTGQIRGNDAGTVALRTASIVKVIIGMRLFARAEEQKRGLTADEQSNLAAMIRSSDNDAASRLWGSLGGPAVINWVRRVTGVRHTAPPANPGSWGFTTTTARDMAVILQALVKAKGISAPSREGLLREMRSVVAGQRWGIGPAVHRSNPAVKNGWYPDSDAPVWRVLCTGIADHAGRSNRWVIVVTTRYPAELGMPYGQETCSGIAARALPPDI